MQVIVDSLLTTYQQTGHGKAVVLLHGWGDSSATFRTLQAELGHSYKVVALDLPGFGSTQMPQDVWGLNDYAEFVAHFLDKIGINSVCAFVGHSNGGAILIRGLSNGVLTASKLVLLASAGIRGEYQGRQRGLRLVAKGAKALMAPFPVAVKQKLRKKAYQAIGSDMFVAEHLQETFKKIVADDVRNDAESISIPTLLIYGTKDTATPVRYGELLQRCITDSQLAVVDGAGHFVHHDAAQKVTHMVEEFLQ